MQAIAYALTALSGAIVALLLMPAVCRAETFPRWAQEVFAETIRRAIVNHQNWYARDFRYVPAGEQHWGNCASFSFTAAVLSMQAEHPAKVEQCGHVTSYL